MPPLMRFLGLILLLVLAPSTEASLKKLIPGNNQAFLPAEEALRLQVTENGDDIYLEFQVMPGHYLYKNRIRFEPLDTSLTAGEPIWSLEECNGHTAIAREWPTKGCLAGLCGCRTVLSATGSND